METRACKVCGETKALTLFPTTKSEGNGRRYRRWECRHCVYLRQAAWRERNAERIRDAGRRSVQRMRERKMQADPQGFRATEAKLAKDYRTQLKAKIYAGYGGGECACCGEMEISFLSIDHTNNDGYTRRKAKIYGSGAMVYGWLWKQFKTTGKWPDGYQILCMNCQHGKARNGGVCPHTSKA